MRRSLNAAWNPVWMAGWAPVAAVVLGLAAAVTPAFGQVLREGSGSRRADLDKMELQPFPNEVWSGVADWTNGAPLTASEIEGKVVVVVTWAHWQPLSLRALSTVERLVQEHGEKGLVAVGLHKDQAWDGAAEAAAKEGVTFRIARDAGEAWRKAMRVDQDPDIYLIDRAGHLRYADIQTQSVAGAVSELIGESKEDAAAIPGNLDADRARAAADARRTGQIRTGFDLAAMPEFPVEKPAAEVYQKLSWPKRYREFERDQLRIDDREAGQVTVALPTSGVVWFDRTPSLNGRAIVLYFWAPDDLKSFERAQPLMDRLQREKGRDLAVIGVVMPFAQRDRYGMSAEEIERERKEFERRVKLARDSRTYDHFNVVDLEATIAKSMFRDDTSSLPRPLAAVLSSDLTLRWIGSPLDSRFRPAVEGVLRVDPAVQARRKAEQAWIREHGGN